MNNLELLKLMIQSSCADGILSDDEFVHLKKKAIELNIKEEDLNFLIQTELKRVHSNTNQSGFMTENNSGFITEEKLTESSSSEKIFTDITELKTQGAMSTIHKAKYLQTKWVIIKRIKKEYKENPAYISLFEKEFDSLFQLDHQNIVRALGKSKDENGIYYFMEYIDGRTISEMIANKEFENEILFKNIMLQILDALIYVHKKQIYHRDLKPENILVTYRGDNVKIIDFGLSLTDSLIENINKVGTPKYSSPEQKINSSEIDHRSDIYSLGIIMLEILTGKTNKSDIYEIKDSVYKSVVQKCLQEKPENRYNSCSEIRNIFLAQKPKKIIPDWLEQKIIEFAEDGKITQNEKRVLELDAKNNNIEYSTLHAVINLHLEKSREKKEAENKKFQAKDSSKKENNKTKKFSAYRFLRRIFILLLIVATGYLSYELYLRYQKSKEKKSLKKYELLEEKKAMYVNVSSLNLRKHANEKSEVIGNYPQGTKVEVVELGYYWARVQIDGKDGYMFLEYLTEKQP